MCTRRLRGPGLVSVAFAGIVALAGCSERGGEAYLDTYRSRLARPLGESIEAVRPGTGLRPPRAEALQLRLAGTGVDGLDFLRLRGCALQTTVARRNSSLGRVAPPSQRLLLELEFLEQVPACIALQKESGNDELATVLADAQALKRSQLPARIFNATLGNREYRDFWRSPSLLGTYPTDTGSEVLTALESITRDAMRWLEGNFRRDEERFELALGTIARGDGGELLIALALQAAQLEAADEAIERRLERGALCSGGRVPDAAPVLRTVVQKFFIGEVQPWSAALNQRYHELLDPILALEEALAPTTPVAYDSWRAQRDALLSRSRQAPSMHVRRLQALLGPCYSEFARAP